MKDSCFEGKIAVVTGAGGTLCSEITVDLAEKGAKVVLIGRTESKLLKVAERVKAFGGTCMIKTGDVTDESAMQKIADEVEKEWGLCDFLVNGAGGNQNLAITTNTEYDPRELSEDKPEDMRGFFDIDMGIFEDVIRINTIGTVVCCRVFAKHMIRKGGGSIINFASMNTYCPLTRVAAYAMSKAAIANYTQWAANYLAPAGIRVNAIAPGFFVNDRSVKILGSVEEGLTERGQSVIGHTSMKRFGQAKDLLGCASWLLNEKESAFVTGITIPVDGGFLTKSGV